MNSGKLLVNTSCRYKIGEVSAEDMRLITENTVYDASTYADNPEPYPDLLTNTR